VTTPPGTAPSAGATLPETTPAPGTAPTAGAPSTPPQQQVLGESGSGETTTAGTTETAPSSAFATHGARGSLPFTGFNPGVLLLLAFGCLGSGLALRRVRAD
jgi:hypothetical protein